MKGVGANVEDELKRLLASRFGKTIQARLKDIEESIQKSEMEAFEKDFERSGYHDKLVDICNSAFGPESKCYTELAYAFVSSEPLIELGVKNFDVLIYNEKIKHAIFVECKTSTSGRGKYISDAYKAKREVIENQTYLENKLGDEIRTIEFVLCIPSENVESIVRELERRECEGEIDVASDDLLLIWQVNMFFIEQTLQLFTRINSRDKPYESQHNDNKLTKMLGSGYKVKSEVLVKFYPSSHPLAIGSKIVVEIVRNNMRADASLKEFSINSVEQFCKSPTNLAHYACETIGKEISDHFIGEGEALGLIESIEGRKGWFRLKLEGKRLNTILNNYKEGYKKHFVTRKTKEKAAKQVIEEHLKEYPDLSTYSEKGN
ncbi:hypothetical protein C4E24_03255 [ANME-1 cluster archaeon AG-394-G21]|nr:hypothetical protein [ANME-1 cluster archaeon AG-394-G21]